MKTDIYISSWCEKNYSKSLLPLVDDSAPTGPDLPTTSNPAIDTLTGNVCRLIKLLEKLPETKETSKNKKNRVASSTHHQCDPECGRFFIYDVSSFAF